MPAQTAETNGQPPLILRLLRNRAFRFAVSYLFISFILITRYGVSDVLQTFFSFPKFLMAAILYPFITWGLLPCIERRPQRARAICIFLSLLFLVVFYANPIARDLVLRALPSSNYRNALSGFSGVTASILALFAGNNLYSKIFDDWIGPIRKPKRQ